MDCTQDNKKVIPFPKERETIALLDENDNVQAYLSRFNPNRLGRAWVALFQSGIMDMAKLGLDGRTWSVWAYMVGTLDFDNYWRIPQKEVAEALGMRKTHVSRAIKELIDKDILIKGPRAGMYNTYRLNPRILHRGTKNYTQNVIEYDELRKIKENREKNTSQDID